MTDSPPPSRASDGERGPRKSKEKMIVHNAVERRYRNSINDRITELDDIIPVAEGDKKKVLLTSFFSYTNDGSNYVPLRLDCIVEKEQSTNISMIIILEQQVERACEGDRIC